MKFLPRVGDRLLINRMTGFKAVVSEIKWSSTDADWIILLDWGSYGTSRVWARDEGKIWFRLFDLN